MAKFGKDPLLGSRIREYEILESIGRGGMGAVYRARHVYLDKQRAIKVVHRSLTESEDFVQRFIREAKVLSELSHPNVVHLYDFGMIDDNTFFMVMELIRGENVIERIQKLTRLTSEDAVRIVREAALGLSSAHRKGIIHRDISPDNLILVRDESDTEITKVVDFGIAKPLHEDTGRFTMTNFFIGKPEYSSPEQCGTLPEGETLDQRSDIYSLGVTFFQMLTGRLPFVASTPQGYLLKHAQQEPQPPSHYLPTGEIPAALDKLVMKMLTKRRQDRHRNLEMVIEELDAISYTEGPTISSFVKQALIAQELESATDETLYADRAMKQSSTITALDIESTSTPTEPLPMERREQQQYLATAPIRSAQPSKGNQIALIILLSAACVCVFGAGGFFLYQFWLERNSESKEDGILVDVEQALKSGDDKKAEELLRKAKAQNRPDQQERLNSLRNQIDALRKQRLVDQGAAHLEKARQFIAGGKLDEASNEIAALQNLNLPEFQEEVQSQKVLIEDNKKKLASQKDAIQLLKEIETAIAAGNLELSEQKLKAFRSRKFQGFESNVASLETKIRSAQKELNLEKGSQLLNEAEKLLTQKRFESAAQKVEQARLLKISDLDQRIELISGRLTFLQAEAGEDLQKGRSLLNSARLLIRVGQVNQAQQWITRARSLGISELQPEIESLAREVKTSSVRGISGNGLEAVESALRRGDWIEAQRLLKAVQVNPPEGSATRIDELDRQILSLRPYVGFGIKRKWEDSDSNRHGIEFGAVVAKVDPNSPAEKSGLQAGDVIIEYDGSVLVEDSQLPWLGAYTKPGSEILLKILRNGNRVNIRVRVESVLASGKS